MQPREFLDVAHALLDRGGPADLRTAISRAYYALHHVGLRAVQEMQIPLPSDEPGVDPGRNHGFVIRCLQHSGDPEVGAVAQRLRSLRSERTSADYFLDEPRPEVPEVARGTVAVAEQDVAILEAALTNDNRRIRMKRELQSRHRRGSL